MKAIILAGGSGTRLHPCTQALCKQLLPIYDKPMIYYPLSVVMLAGLREVLLITTEADQPLFHRLLGDGAAWGLSLTYAVQPRPEGLAQALTIGRDFLDGGPCCLILGDNLFFGHGLSELLRRGAALRHGGLIYGYRVADPSAYGVVELDAAGRPLGIEEKPAVPRSPYAVPGLYFYGAEVCDDAATLPRGARGEYEITDLNRRLLQRGDLAVELMGRGLAWLDTGTPQGLLEASNLVAALQQRQGLGIACLEEIAFHQGWIDIDAVRRRLAAMGRSPYAAHVAALLHDDLKAVA